MKIVHILLAGTLLMVSFATAQDWQDYKTDSSYSFKEVKAAVSRVSTNHAYTGWDEKIFSRTGDLTSVAILQTLDDAEMLSPDVLNDLLPIIRAAFSCPETCITVASDREPRVALLLLEHLHSHTTGKMQNDVDDLMRYVVAQKAGKVN